MTSCCTNWRRVVSGDAHGFGPSLARGALSALSIPYGWGASLKDVVSSTSGESCGIPVISIGNIAAGGTGKTPFASLVVSELVKRGRRPVVISRGYRAAAGQLNDEAKMLQARHPGVLHLHGVDRLATARHVVDAQLGDSIVLDDGFQVRNLRKDLNVCLLDATNPWGYGSVLPRGLLREPLSALYRARPVVITRAELVGPERIEEIRRVVRENNEHAVVLVSEMKYTGTTDLVGGARGPVSELSGKRVLCASGIGNPSAFAGGVRMLGARVMGHMEFDDHHDWTAADLAALCAKAAEVAAEIVVTTAKDAVKLAALERPSTAPAIRVLDVEAVIRPEGGGAATWAKFLDEALAAA